MKLRTSVFFLFLFLSFQTFAQENELDSLSRNLRELRKTVKEGFGKMDSDLQKIDTNRKEIRIKLDSVNKRLDSINNSIQNLKKTLEKKKEKKAKKDTIQGWKTGGMTSLNATQVSLTNWAAGGQNSVSGAGFVNFFADYKRNTINWENNIDLGYGLIKQGTDEVIKSDDKMELTSSFGKNFSKHFLYNALLSFKSQFAPGYDYPNDSVKISDFLAPAYIQLALGIEYNTNNGFSFTLSPATGKITVVNDQTLADQGAYGVEGAEYDEAGNKISDGQRVREEIGAAAKIKIKKDLFENVSLSSSADFFSNYLHNPQNIDVNWETVINMKINSFLSANFKTHLIYDDDIDIPVDRNGDGIRESSGPRTQFKQVAGVGFSYKF